MSLQFQTNLHAVAERRRHTSTRLNGRSGPWNYYAGFQNTHEPRTVTI
jgi:hypothetical protein